MAESLGLDPTECERPEFALVMSGAAPLPGSKTFSQCYGAHTFASAQLLQTTCLQAGLHIT